MWGDEEGHRSKSVGAGLGGGGGDEGGRRGGGGGGGGDVEEGRGGGGGGGEGEGEGGRSARAPTAETYNPAWAAEAFIPEVQQMTWNEEKAVLGELDKKNAEKKLEVGEGGRVEG